jgi:phosphoglycolate phosphatase-like HAD superfamily hydrolase
MDNRHVEENLPVQAPVRAIVWDYDGTLVDSRIKNRQVNRKLVADITGRPADDFPPMRSMEAYEAADSRAANWREFYHVELGLTEEQTDEAGRLWASYQLRDDTVTPFLEGIPQALAGLGHLPQGIVSQNGSQVILKELEQAGLAGRFGCVVGYEEVGPERQKPAPDGLIACLQTLTGLAPGIVFYIGDFETDGLSAVQANETFRRRGLDIQTIMIAASYGYPGAGVGWSVPADYVANSPADVVAIVGPYTSAEEAGA